MIGFADYFKTLDHACKDKNGPCFACAQLQRFAGLVAASGLPLMPATPEEVVACTEQEFNALAARYTDLAVVFITLAMLLNATLTVTVDHDGTIVDDSTLAARGFRLSLNDALDRMPALKTALHEETLQRAVDALVAYSKQPPTEPN
jgi:hypothetical protein